MTELPPEIRRQFCLGEMMLRAVVFDMDGVILDSERLAHAAWREFASADGLPDIDCLYADAMGRSEEEIAVLFRERYGFDGYPEFRERVLSWSADHVPGGIIPLREGARELLDFLRDHEIRTGLATATELVIAQKELIDTGVWDCFDHVVTGDQVSNCKPDPEIYLKACALLDVRPEETYGVEDGRNGILALHAAGMPAILTEDQYHPSPEIAALCEVVLPSLHKVKEFFGTILHERI